MTRNRAVLALVVLISAAALSFYGCKKKKRAEPPPDTDTTPTPTASVSGNPSPTATQAPAGGKGSITGSVAFTGTAPAAPDIKPDKDPSVCGAAIPDETVLVNGNKTLKNVVVRVVSDMKVPGPSTPVVLDQKGCRYLPHVSVATMGQKLEAHSSDTTIMHNVHSYQGEGDAQAGLDNISQPPGSPPAELALPEEGGPLLVKCDVHPWMTAHVIVSPHPFAAVTGDDGSFKIEGVPAGHYTIEAWHEKFGKKTVEIDVGADKATEAKFEYSGS